MKKIIIAALALSMLSACATDPYTGESKVSKTAWGTGIGTALGAGVGALIGGQKGALIGAGVGALGGAATGGYMDVQARELRQKLTGTGVQLKQLDNGQILLIMPSNITFATNSDVFQTGFNSILDSVALVLKKYDKTLINVVGHTDSVGSDEYNMQLSAKRALAVSNYLALRGVAENRMVVRAMGEKSPIASNDTEAGRAQNRRVEITIQQMN
ncbi:MAG: OmpA family protein [Alphaproteobacteria bacterium]|nr:OmpA family protein [Alphaproteobacteria bacterium]